MSLIPDEYLGYIQRWIKKVDSRFSTNSEPEFYTVKELCELANIEEQSKKSIPSYIWIPDEQEKWWRIWFKESNLTIQIDLHFSDLKYEYNFKEINLDECDTAAKLLDYIYHIYSMQVACPEMIWAIMEVIDLASEKCQIAKWR